MQEFTRSLTREIQINGERLAVTLDKEGMSIRPVGSRRPPTTLSWSACLCAAVSVTGDSTPEQISAAMSVLKTGRKDTATKSASPEESGEEATSASEAAPAAAPAAPSGALADVLTRIDQGLAKHRARFVKALDPGATPKQLEEAEKHLGRPLPEGLRTLLAWHNGQNPDVFGAFEQRFYLMSAAQIADMTQDLKANPPDGWQPGWLPFLDDDADSYVIVDTDKPGLPVHEVWRGKAKHPVVAPSLANWLERFADGVEKGEYVEDAERGAYNRKS